MPSVEPALPVPLTTEPACSDEQHRASVDSAENGKMIQSNIIKKYDSILITKKSILGTPKNSKQPPILKLGQGHEKSRIQTPYKTTHRRPSTLYPKSDYHQVGWNYETQLEQLFQPPMYNQWSPYPPFPYMGQPNRKTPYELFKGKKRSLEHFKVFGSKCFILNTKDYLTKFDPKSTEGVFLGYSPNSKTYIVLNKETMEVEEYLNVKFDETPPPKSSPLVDDDILENDIIKKQDKDLEIKENEPLNKEISNIKSSKDHPLGTVIGNLNERTLRSHVQNQSNFFCFVSSVKILRKPYKTKVGLWLCKKN
ncbi:retrovirus-related pol polyprotein from transposon TNT 1-94 [Tanacetum coccineum]|uniref:Retrovirus-related pol polyprotein from transposon TNT 1-94 n=1 Tax=Tanacetum coccineum TaxID=301880 RepID=A0ABQ5ACG0_9ASTR